MNEKISKIARVIDEIAFQNDILALTAAIAGEAPRIVPPAPEAQTVYETVARLRQLVGSRTKINGFSL
jgi:hypothetical protein